MTIYKIGTGIADITDGAVGLVLQGMADPGQKVTGIEKRLYARAFVIEGRKTKRRAGIVVADMWTGTQAVKAAVLQRLQGLDLPYTEDNLLISGTHTHSGPGGFSHSALYENAGGGFDQHTFQCIVSGIVTALLKAESHLLPGKIYINKGDVQNCGRQRSKEAYDNNREARLPNTDKEMLLLKFVTLDQRGELPIGALSWYAIHPVDLSQKNTKISGDNKGYASYRFERLKRTDYTANDTFVAAFANANCGDVSPNVELGISNGRRDRGQMILNGTNQYDRARQLFDSATEELQGEVDYRHQRVDMSNVTLDSDPLRRTWPGALGLSFAAGSTEDSIPMIADGIESFRLREGLYESTVFPPSEMRLGTITPPDRTAQGIIISALATQFGTTEDHGDFTSGHHPKPIVLRTGLLDPPITANAIPLQLIRIGSLVITAVPSELTTMAGRRLRDTVLNELRGTGIEHLALACYANDYAQYVSTKEEYDMQHYEGASTLFGPWTLEALQLKFAALARALKNGNTVSAGPASGRRTAKNKMRITIRNRRSSKVNLKWYDQSDQGVFGIMVPFADFDVPANCDFYFEPPNKGTFKARLNDESTIRANNIHNLSLVTITNGSVQVGSYSPDHAPIANISTINRQGVVEVPDEEPSPQVGEPDPQGVDQNWLTPVLHIMMGG